jgi:hypothetical protein
LFGFLGRALGGMGGGGQGAPLDIRAPRAGGGMFGRRGGGNFNWRRALIGAGSGMEGLEAYDDRLAAARLARRQARKEEMEEREEQERIAERRAFERWIAGRREGGMNQQDEYLARAFPEMAARQAYETIPQWQANPGMTNAIRIDPVTGEVQRGGALPLRPRAPPTPYALDEDDGYDYY